jgi:phosphoenolpyruvate carboxykinase (GTP)
MALIDPDGAHRVSQNAATKPNTVNHALNQWVAESASLTQPDQIFWCDGSAQEQQRLTAQAVDAEY